jgi:hypothetical protein
MPTTTDDLIALTPEDELTEEPPVRPVTYLRMPEEIREGARNSTLASLAGSMRRAGGSVGAITAALLNENRERCKPPLPTDEIHKIARSIGRYAPPPRAKVQTQAIRSRARLEFASIDETAREIGASPPVGFLASPVWPGDAYGVLAAEDKAGKTWALLDLAVAVASGGSWLGRFRCEQGPVLLFLGEGGPRRMVRRLNAVATHASQQAPELPIRAAFRVPHLTDREHLDEVARELAEHPARLVVLDPLYLAARGANGALLYEMGEHLENLQRVTQDAGAALVVATHYNKTGEGRGPKRITGAGPGAWGRVLVTVDVVGRHSEPSGASVVTLGFDFMGDEIAESSLRIRRRVWVEDPSDLTSPMHYELEPADDAVPSDPELAGLGPAAIRVLSIVESEGRDLSVRDIGDLTATARWALKARTIQTALRQLEERGLVTSRSQAHGELLWRATYKRKETESCR